MRILAVDDNEESLYMLTTLLRGNGYEVIAACDGIAALDILKTQRADLIMSDILMPRMDGFQLCRTVKSDPTLREIPFVFYTATYTEKRDIDLAMSLGAQRFLIKPLDVDVVLQAVAEVLSKHGET
ncbi:MAG TPA: response regulator, partial [Dissulfurispiraceae bacterium]|nr:response regulator [Dissulfurispiraceae bacterium]